MKISQKNKRLINFYLLAFIIVIALILVSIFYIVSPIGRVILDLDEVTLDSDAILGRVRLILNEGELIPYDSIIKINLNEQNVELPINSLITREKETGLFYVENTDLDGSGEGFGIQGTKTTYPVIYFRLKIEKTVKSSSPDIGIPEDSSAPSNEKTSDIITTQAIVTDFIDGQVTGLVDFEYELDSEESASIIEESVNDGTNALDESIVNLMIDGNIAMVSTDYVIEEQGFGPEYTNGEEVILEIDFSEFNISPEEGILSVEVAYGNYSLLYGEKIIFIKGDIYGVPPTDNLSEEIEESVGNIIEKLIPEEPIEEEEEIVIEAEENITEEEIVEEEVGKDMQFGALAGPSDPTVFINSSQGTNTSVENITCWASADDADSAYLNYSGFWYKDGEQQFNNFNTSTNHQTYYYLTTDSQDNIIGTGYTYYNAVGEYDIFTIKVNSSGTVLWQVNHGDTSFDQGWGVATDSNDNIVITGYSRNVTSVRDQFVVVKYNPSGTHLWNQSCGGVSISGDGRAVAIDSQDNIYAVGGCFNLQKLFKYNSSGSELWNLTLATSPDGIAIDSQDNFIIVGSNFALYKYNSSGTNLWNHTTTIPSTTGKDIAIDAWDNILILGYGGGNDVRTAKYNSSGSYLWNHTWEGPGSEQGHEIDSDSKGNVYSIGYTTSFGEGSLDTLVIKYNSSGSQIFNFTVGSASADYTFAGTVDNQDNFVVTRNTYVSKYYGFSLDSQSQGEIVQVATFDESRYLADDVMTCEVKAFDGTDYTNYTSAEMTMLGVPLVCGINITEDLTANISLSCNDTAIYITANNVNLDCNGINIIGNQTPGTYGVEILEGYNGSTVENCVISNFSAGVYSVNSFRNDLSNNILQNNLDSGIKIENLEDSNVSSNTISDSPYGIFNRLGDGNYIYNNLVTDTSVAGLILDGSLNIEVESNEFSNSSLYGALISNDTEYSDFHSNDLDANAIGLLINDSDNNQIYSNTLDTNTEYGILLKVSNNNSLNTNLITTNDIGISVNDSFNNTLYSNTIYGSDYGLFFSTNTTQNLIYDNWINNTVNSYCNGTNLWNTTADFRENIIAGSYIGGNYWADYTGNDSDRDGFGDTLLPWNASENISVGGDYLPLTEEYRPIIIQDLTVVSTTGTPDGDIYCVANTSNDNDANVTYHGFWYKNNEQQFENIEHLINDSLTQPVDIAIDSDDNVLVIGGVLIAYKFNASGDLLWNSSVVSGITAKSIAVDPWGNVVAAGFVGTAAGAYVIKFNASGTPLWNQTFLGGSSSQAYGVETDSQGNVIVVGLNRFTGSDPYQALTVKYNSSGSYQWNATHDGTSVAYGAAVDSSDNYFVVGYRSLSAVVLKYNSSGTKLWSNTYGEISSYTTRGWAANVDSFNNILFTGFVSLPSDTAIFTAKVDKYGNYLWSHLYDGGHHERGQDLIVDRQDNVLTVGYTASFDTSYDGIILKYSKDGDFIAYELFGEEGEADYGYAVALDSREDIFIGGNNPENVVLKYEGFVLENQIPGVLTNLSNKGSSAISNGDTWYCEAMAFDTVNYSKVKVSPSITLYVPGTSGGGRGACISSWSCSQGPCVGGSAEEICEDSNGCLSSTNFPSGCVSSGHAECTRTVSCGEEEEEEQNMTMPEQQEAACSESWTCDGYGNCEVDGYKYPLNCIDINDCGTTNDQPQPLLCDCTPVLECGDWQECRVDYGFDDLVEAEYIDLNGTQIRDCFDTSDCITYPVEEEQECSVTVPVSLIEEAWGNETYVFVLDELNQTVARVKIGSLFLTFMPTSYLGYFDYCFNEIQDYDETGVDCGGSCPSCVEEYEDNFILIKSFVLAISIVLGFFMSFWTIRDLFKEVRLHSILKKLKPVSYKKIHRK